MGKDGLAFATQADMVIGRLERVPIFRFHARLGTLLAVGTFFDAYDSIVISVVLTVVFTTLRISLLASGLLISVAYVGQLVGSLAAGYLSERYGRRKVFVGALAVFGAFSVLAGLSWDYNSLFAFRLLQGFGLGAEVPIAAAIFNEFLRGQGRGLAVMLYENAFSWGLLAAPLLALAAFSLFGQANGWRSLFFLGGLPLVVAVVALRRLPESVRWLVAKGRVDDAVHIVDAMEKEAQRRGIELAPVQALRADVAVTKLMELFAPGYLRRTVLCWSQWFTTYFVTYGFTTTWLPSLYVRLGHLPVSSSLWLTVASSALGLANGYFFAMFVDRIGRKSFFSFGFALAAAGALAGFLLVEVFHVMGWPVLFLVGVAVSFGAGYSNLGVYVYTPELYPTRMRAWATATGGAWNRFASIIGPTAVGALLGAGLGIGSVFLLTLGVLLFGLVMMLSLGIETKRQALEELAT